MTEYETREHEGVEQKKCPHCEKFKDPRGFSSHVEYCDEKEVEEENESENMTDEYEEVNPGKEVETAENPTCPDCGTFLVDADKYVSEVERAIEKREWNNNKLNRNQITKLRRIAKICKNHYAVCVECQEAFEKVEI